jgi:hypothetical protein
MPDLGSMSLRRQLYDLLQALPDGNAAARISAVGEFLDGLSAEEAELAARRLVALTIAYRASVLGGLKGTLDEFFQAVDAAEQDLLN